MEQTNIGPKLNIDYPVAVTGGFGTRGNNKSHILRIIGCK